MDKEITVYLTGTNYKAHGIYDQSDNSIKILKNSKIKEQDNSLLKESSKKYNKLKNSLIEKKALLDNEFVKDYVFNDILEATLLVTSNKNINENYWKLNKDKTLEEFKIIHNNINNFIMYYESQKSIDVTDKKVKQNETIENFNNLFPLEKLKTLSIEEYDKRGSRDSLTYMIEHGTNEVFNGSFGFNRNKLFYQQKDGTYECIEFMKNKFPNISVEELFIYFRDNLYDMLVNFSKDNYILTEPENANTIKGKLVMLYYPNELITLNSLAIYQKLFKHFGLNYKHKDSIILNIELQEFLDSIGVNVDLTKTAKILFDYYNKYLIESKEESKEEEIKATNFDDVFISQQYIEKIIRILKRKQAIILKGVPGVGKTFTIKSLLSRSFDNIGENGIEMIQFHQSYSYEEFIEGLKPQMDGSFEAEKGIFYDISKRAQDDPDNNYFLVIDEINRGNLSKIFGELMMLIENDKRDSYVVKLAYSKELFTVPNNLYIIGTMNTADRSLTLVDYALRRRFAFFTLEPAFDTEKFNKFLVENMKLEKKQLNKINNTMTKINRIIEHTLGNDFIIGHSYFVVNEGEVNDFAEWYDDIVTFEIIPMIEEYYFDDEVTSQRLINILVGSNEEYSN
ncbi:AAA family ATPase [Staphylococcus kloosii]|jgi:5-methylcytosine-specific restriction endonuclease McrBC GTP-binding regulatory subunit McrB|uniref:AAA family ATPase n=1 Tax=Staphylococcus kloosii TaxID=29384 RepID=UPI000D1F91D6|nr:AAA family ATPase [Staphylococcus kloosii]PTJ79310.1 hypothetical protein BUZ59_04035 [Staphylococcus kloosii]